MQTNTAFTCARGAGRVQVVDCEGLNLNILYDDSLKGYFTQPFQTSMHFFYAFFSFVFQNIFQIVVLDPIDFHCMDKLFLHFLFHR